MQMLHLRAYTTVWTEDGDPAKRDSHLGWKLREQWALTPAEVYCLMDDVQRIVMAGRMGDEKAVLRKRMAQYVSLVGVIEPLELESSRGRSQWILTEGKVIEIFPFIAHAMEVIVYGRRGAAGDLSGNGYVAPEYRDELTPAQTKWVLSEWRQLVSISQDNSTSQVDKGPEEEAKGQARDREWITIPYKTSQGLRNTNNFQVGQWQAVKQELLNMLFKGGDCNL
jgi:hypothetical protein